MCKLTHVSGNMCDTITLADVDGAADLAITASAQWLGGQSRRLCLCTVHWQRCFNVDRHSDMLP